MALSLMDLIGETVLVARDPSTNSEEELQRSKYPHLRDAADKTRGDGQDNEVEECEVNENRRNNVDQMRTEKDDDTEEQTCDYVGGSSEDAIVTEGYNLVTKDGVVLDIVNVSDLIGPDVVIGLYFTTSSSPECGETTQHLVALHNSLASAGRARSPSSGGSRRSRLKLVVVAGDEECYRHFLATTPFYVLPYHYHHIGRALRRRYRVASLATLILLDSRSARVISRPSLEHLSSDPQGLTFPWRPRPLKEILDSLDLEDPSGAKVDFQAIRSGYKALYFGAHWCPPCRAFTPLLLDTYERVRQEGHPFEVIFVSSDRSEDSYRSYHSSMAWPGVPWREHETRRELAAALQVEGIPCLVLLGQDDSVLTHQGRVHVTRDTLCQEFPWRDQSVELLDDRELSPLLERPCFIIFADKPECGPAEQYRELLLPVAEEYLLHRVHGPPDAATLAFMVAGPCALSDSLRLASGVGGAAPQVVILDLAEDARYTCPAGTISTASLHAFLTRYNRQELEPEPIEDSYEDVKAEDEAQLEYTRSSEQTEADCIL